MVATEEDRVPHVRSVSCHEGGIDRSQAPPPVAEWAGPAGGLSADSIDGVILPAFDGVDLAILAELKYCVQVARQSPVVLDRTVREQVHVNVLVVDASGE